MNRKEKSTSSGVNEEKRNSTLDFPVQLSILLTSDTIGLSWYLVLTVKMDSVLHQPEDY